MVIFAVEIIYCMDTDDYKIEYHRLCRSVLSAVSAFKRATGVSRCCIETTDFEYDEELNEDGGVFVKPGNKLGINVYIGDDASDYSETDDDE